MGTRRTNVVEVAGRTNPQAAPARRRAVPVVTADLASRLDTWNRNDAQTRVTIGQLLTEGKAQMPHDDWLAWLDREMPFSARPGHGVRRGATNIRHDREVRPTRPKNLRGRVLGGSVMLPCSALSGGVGMLLIGCSPPPLEPTGVDPTTLTDCLVGAVKRRAACNGNGRCQVSVGEDWSYPCYAELYRKGEPGGMETLGPCFWDDDGSKAARCRELSDAEGFEACRQNAKRETVLRTCGRLALPRPEVQHCEAELWFAVDDLCTRGDPALTGAGP